MTKLSIFFILFTSTLTFAQKGSPDSITVFSSFYNNQSVIVQGGIFPDSYGYNDFYFSNVDSSQGGKSFKVLEIRNNKAIVPVMLTYPHPFSIMVYDAQNNQGHSSKIFFVDDHNAAFNVNDLSADKNLTTLVASALNQEYQNLQKLYSSWVDSSTGRVHNFQAKQKVLQRYISMYPDSFIALWDLILEYPTVETSDMRANLMKTLLLFSPTVKASKTYKAFEANINADLELSPGKRFPNISLSQSDSLYNLLAKEGYTLVDFWFTGCAGCIEQFPAYKNIYHIYGRGQFQIVGISIDAQKDTEKWKRMINKFQLDWLHFQDPESRETDKLFIRKFPTNFLLNSKGEIVLRDISTKDLNTFLKSHLK